MRRAHALALPSRGVETADQRLAAFGAFDLEVRVDLHEPQATRRMRQIHVCHVVDVLTAKRLGTKIVVMVWEDGGYGLIAWKQDNQFGRHTRLGFGNPDFLKLADAFGWRGFRCEKSAELRGVLAQAMACEGPALVVIPIDYRENALLSERLGNIVCPI